MMQTNGDDRFYNATKVWRNRCKNYWNKLTVEMDSSSLVSDLDRSSNLDRFLDSTTPSVTAKYISKTRIREWSTCDVEYMPYFTLGDLWESFKEWSAYGAGVPLVLNGGDCAVQYYVPYLSGIQLYGDSSRPTDNFRQIVEDSDIDCYRDSCSDGSSDCDLDWGQNHVIMRENNVIMQEGFSSDDNSDTGNPRGRLLFQYLERDPPYSREPLVNKVLVLASRFPELMTLRSCDLLPESWISIAWYPIYRIPTGPTLKDLDACFLTFHSLATPMGGITRKEVDGVPKIPLPCFGLASYKFKGPLWTLSGGCEKQLASSLLRTADSWLQFLSVDLPDFRFFTSHGAFPR